MDGLNTIENMEGEEEFSFKNYFIPLTTVKAITWIVVIGIIVYANMLFNGFVWDDISYILLNQQVHSINFATIFGPSLFNDAAAGYYRPFPALYFSLIYSLFQNTTFMYHFLQLLLHVADGVLVFLFFKKFFSSILLSFFLSLIFLVHPINSESVDSIAQTISPLLLLFGISAMLLSFTETINPKRLFAINLLLLSAILTKETGILFFLMIPVYKVFFSHKKGLKIYFFTEVLTLILYFVLRFVVGNVHFLARSDLPIGQLSFTERLVNVPAVFFYYIQTFFFPLKLAFDQRWIVTNLTLSTFYLPLFADGILFLLLIIFGRYLFKKNKRSLTLLLFFSVWFILGFAMLSQIFPLDMTVADHWFYLPIIGILGIVGVFISSIMGISSFLKRFGAIIAISILILLTLRTMVRNSNWYDPITLYSHDIQISDNYDLEYSLGMLYRNNKDYTKALQHFKQSIRLYPTPQNLYQTGFLYEKLHKYQQAAYYYNQSIDLNLKRYSNYYSVIYTSTNYTQQLEYLEYSYIELVSIDMLSNRPETALATTKLGLRYLPDSAPLYMMKAVNEYIFHHQKEALADAQKAHDLLPIEVTTNLYTQIANNQPAVDTWFKNNLLIGIQNTP